MSDALYSGISSLGLQDFEHVLTFSIGFVCWTFHDLARVV